jgi:diguanylate cyclase (GGDEF)-like protein
MFWTGIAFRYFDEAASDRKDAERTNSNFAMVFEENALRAIGEIDKALLYLRRTIEAKRPPIDFNEIANTADVLSEIIVQVAIIDADGIMRASNVGPQPAPPLDLSDREHFRAHLNSRDDRLFISKPLVGRSSHKWSVQFTRRFLNRQGEFGGVVVASLNPEHLTKVYNQIDFGSSISISLIGSDGIVRSSGGNIDAGFPLGADLSDTKVGSYIAAGNRESFELVYEQAGAPSLVTVRKVKGHPLWVVVGIGMEDIYRGSWSTFQFLSLAGIVLTIVILSAMEVILRSEAAAKQKSDQLQLTLENMSQGIMLVTKDLEIPVINTRCAELLELPDELIENPAGLKNAPGHQKFFQELAVFDLKRDRRSGEIAVRDRKMSNGHVIEIRSAPLNQGGIVHTFTDVTQRCAAEAHIAKLASEDPLTGLANRRVFASALDDLFAQRNRGNTCRESFAVFFLDLDRFKLINDTLGHRTGDRLLQIVGERLNSVVGELGLLARLGGDEFAVVISSFSSREALGAWAANIGQVISEPAQIDANEVRTTASIGIAVGPEDGDCGDDLLMGADLALYAVKTSGRGTFKFFDKSMNQQASERRRLEIDLQFGLENNQLELHYQPTFSAADNLLTGFEALARWSHPERGMISPNLFIPIAEDSRLIIPLGLWALKEACKNAAAWPAALKVAVNLSPVQFSMPDLVGSIREILSETGLDASRLELEITERVVLDGTDSTLQTLYGLKALGIRIAMDDFGTGYSSLSYLRSFAFDRIKIDRTFVSDVAHGDAHVVIVQSLISIARALGMKTTAEGIETPAQQEFLAALGCDELQGFFLGRPVQLKDVPGIISGTKSRQTLAA